MDIANYFNANYLTSLYKKKLAHSKAKGIDKINCLNFEEKLNLEIEIIARKVNSGKYKFSPYIENLKLKGRGKVPRVISIPTLRDRIVLLTLKEILHELFPKSINKKLPNRYIHEIKRYLEDTTGNEYFIKLDIEKFYDNINREILLEKIQKNLDPLIVSLIRQALETPTIPINSKKDTYEYFVTDKGVPQGLSISNILAQIYLEKVDEVIDKRSYFYRRYVDDIIVLNHQHISDYRYKNIEKELKIIDLQLNHDKTEKRSLTEGFTFLGYKIELKNISIADANVERFIRRIAGKFTWFKNGMIDKSNRPSWLDDDNRFKEIFIEELNEAITGIVSTSQNYGWIFYFSELTDERLLHKIDKIISRFFSSLDSFNNTRPSSLKKISRAFRVIKYQKKKNYIANYDNYDSIRSKRNFLLFRGKINPEINYSDSQIEFYFEKFRNKQIKKVERDIGYNYN